MIDSSFTMQEMAEYDQLCQMIMKWNKRQLDLFKMSMPNEVR